MSELSPIPHSVLLLGNMKLVLVLCICLDLIVTSEACQPRIPPNTVISGNPPIPKNQGAMRWVIESVGLRVSFAQTCGSPSSRPTCNCSDGSQFRHPYFIALCSDGSENTSCACPDGTSYP